MNKWQKKVEQKQLEQYNHIEYLHKVVVIMPLDEWNDAKKWLKDNVERKSYLMPNTGLYDYSIHIKDPYTGIGITRVNKVIRFRFKSDAMAFKLRWL